MHSISREHPWLLPVTITHVRFQFFSLLSPSTAVIALGELHKMQSSAPRLCLNLFTCISCLSSTPAMSSHTQIPDLVMTDNCVSSKVLILTAPPLLSNSFCLPNQLVLICQPKHFFINLLSVHEFIVDFCEVITFLLTLFRFHNHSCTCSSLLCLATKLSTLLKFNSSATFHLYLCG